MTGPVVYHTGFLATDRQADKDLDRRAAALLLRAAAGEVTLYQRRLEADRYEYFMAETAAQDGRAAA
jgi:hypothetical protein